MTRSESLGQLFRLNPPLQNAVVLEPQAFDFSAQVSQLVASAGYTFDPASNNTVTINYTPVTTRYLEEATRTLAGGDGGAFGYRKQVLAGDTAVLEFETSVEGKYVNGVDIVRCDEAGRIVEFRVMMRPLRGIQAVHEQMGRLLAAAREAAARR